MKRFSCAVKCNVKPLDLCYPKNLIFVTQRICPVYTGKEQRLKLGFEPDASHPNIWGVQPALDSLCCEKYLISPGEVTNPWVRSTCVVQLWGHKLSLCL